DEELLLHVGAFAALGAVLAARAGAFAIGAVLAAVFRAASAGVADRRSWLTGDAGGEQGCTKKQTAKQFDDHRKLTFLNGELKSKRESTSDSRSNQMIQEQ